ncbi:MAG: thioesterase family protein [Anaerolineae bacterium]
MENLEVGVVGEVRRTVEDRHTARHLGSGNVSVLATPIMVGLMEEAAIAAVDHLLPEGQQTVGIHLDVRHLAPTPVGMEVVARAELTDIDGRILKFRVTAEDENEQVGDGTHTRAIIDMARFQGRIAKKQTNG